MNTSNNIKVGDVVRHIATGKAAKVIATYQRPAGPTFQLDFGHSVKGPFGIEYNCKEFVVQAIEPLYEPAQIGEPAKPSSWMTDYTAEDFQKLQPKYEIHELDADVMGHRYRSTVSGVGELQVFVSDYAGNEAHALYYIWDEFAGEVKANVRPLDYLRSILTEARGWQRIS